MSIIERAIEAARSKAATQPPPEAAPAPKPASPDKPSPATPKPVVAGPAETVAFMKLATRGDIVTEASNRVMYEQFRRVKRPLLKAAFGPLAAPGMQIIMVTSPLPNAGKTFVSANLAYVLAREKDRRVLLVDVDNAHQSLTRELGLEGRPGIFDVVNDPGMLVHQVIYGTDVPGLSVLASGPVVPDSLERLNSARCRDTIAGIVAEDPSRILIMDAPPMLVTNEAPAMTHLAGQMILVVEAGVSTQSSIVKALELLDHEKPIGLILNKTPGNPGGTLYYPAYPAYPANAPE